MADAIQISISIKPPLEDLAAQYNLTERQVQQIGTAAINRSTTTVRSRIVKRLAGEINLRQKDIRESVLIDKATSQQMIGLVTIHRTKPEDAARNKTGIPLIDFIGTRQTKAGVSVQVRKAGPRQVLTSTFIGVMENKHTGVFERARLDGVGLKAGYIQNHLEKYPNRAVPLPSQYLRFGKLPIVERFGLTLTGYLSHAPQVVAEEQAAAGDILQKNVLSQLQRRLAERKPTSFFSL